MLVTLIVVFVLLVVYGVVLYNGLVTLRRQTNHALGQLEIQLKRRYDALPRLVELVKGDLSGEQESLEKVLQARAQALNARTVIGRAAAEAQVSRALSHLFTLTEAHSELKFDDELVTMREEFRSTQNKIAFARQYYNDIVAAYNLRLESFPSSLLASLGKFPPIEPFEAEDSLSREPIPVVF